MVKRVQTVRLGGCALDLFPTVKGLESERGPVREAILLSRPEVVALPVSAEGLRGLRAIWKGKEPEFFLSHYEEIYAVKLARFGKICIPPPSFTEAYSVAAGEGIPVRAIDLDEEQFSDAFVQSISTSNLIYHSLRWRWLKRKRFNQPMRGSSRWRGTGPSTRSRASGTSKTGGRSTWRGSLRAFAQGMPGCWP